MNIRQKVHPSEHRGLSDSNTGGIYMKFVKQNVATTPSEFQDALNKYKLKNPVKYKHMLKFLVLDAYSQRTDAYSERTDAYSERRDAFSQGTDARSQGTDARSQGTDARSQGTDAYSERTDAFSQGTDARSQGTAKKPTVFKTKGKETLPRDPHAILALLRDHFTENELDTVFKLPSAGSFSACHNKPPNNLYRLCNASKPNCFKGKSCFQSGRYEKISAIFKKSKSTNKLFKVE